MRALQVLSARWPVSPFQFSIIAREAIAPCPSRPKQSPGAKDENGARHRFGTGKRANGQTGKRSGFTLLELLIVISIIAILAAAIVPNFIGFDAEARIAATQSNLNTLRTRVTLFRAKEGRNPEQLEELLTATYDDMGAQVPYLEEMPAELISSKSGNATVENRLFKEGFPNDGGWVYITDRRKVVVDVTDSLDGSWGSYEGEVPAEW